MWLDVSGKRMQSGNTKTMIFGCHYLMHYITQFMVLEAGDVVTTGTPPGVALGQKPTPTFLKAGDVMHLHIAGLGEQKTKVVELKA
jgi:2-keto-4-pentenoate hydratase/2-oxohepta-3-ene-1,7-dioic acid hydratase in catechol pathway